MTAACPACDVAPAAVNLAEVPNAVQLSVPSIRCAACIGAIEDHLGKLPGVETARVNATQRRVSVVTDLPVGRLVHSLADIGYEAHPLDGAALSSDKDPIGKELILRIGISGFAMMNVMLLSVAVWSGATDATRDLFHLISAGIAIPAVFYAGQPFFRHAWQALRVRRLNMDVPISLAIVLACLMSLYEALNGGEHAYFEAAVSLTFFLLIGRYLEHRTRSAARSAANELAALEVHTAQRKIGNTVETVPIDALHVGETVLVPTGVRVPVDGVLLGAEAYTDRSFLTGESDPITVAQGAPLSAGEINLGAPFEMRAEAIGGDTRLRQIAQMVETAENARNKYTSIADRAARIYAPVVHILAGVTFAGWMIATGDIRHSLNIAIAVLIITCPCALGLAVPAVSTAAISGLYKLGFLVKSGTALERLAEVKSVVLDKTGTLTQPGFSFDLNSLTDEQKAVAKALTQSSSHPLSKALGKYLSDVKPVALTDVQEHAGAGVTAMFEGRPVALGRATWLVEEGHDLVLDLGSEKRRLHYSEASLPGADVIADALKAEGLAAEIVSGDTAEKTRLLAQQLDIPDWRSGMSPEDKAHYVTSKEADGLAPCMIGDGINDTAALARAHASVAPGTALDATRNAADVVMMGDTLADVPKLFSVSKRAIHLSRQNFGIAIAYNAIAVPVAVAGFATPLLAALAMSASSITVLLNAMRVRT